MSVLTKFADEVSSFFVQPGLERLLVGGLDHLAVKTKDQLDYQKYKNEILPLCLAMTEADLDGRKIATAKLDQAIVLTNSTGQELGRAFHLEIMEPRPTKIGRDLIGLDHIEFAIESFARAQEQLRSLDIPTNQGDGEDQYQHTVVVRINNRGQEVKLSDEPLSQLVIKELAEGKAKQLK